MFADSYELKRKRVHVVTGTGAPVAVYDPEPVAAGAGLADVVLGILARPELTTDDLMRISRAADDAYFEAVCAEVKLNKQLAAERFGTAHLEAVVSPSASTPAPAQALTLTGAWEEWCREYPPPVRGAGPGDDGADPPDTDLADDDGDEPLTVEWAGGGGPAS